MGEKYVETEIRKYLKSIGAEVIKIHGSAVQGRGYPDFVICYRGRYVAWEIKDPEGALAQVQNATLKRLQKAGAFIGKPRSVAQAKELIHEIDLALG